MPGNTLPQPHEYQSTALRLLVRCLDAGTHGGVSGYTQAANALGRASIIDNGPYDTDSGCVDTAALARLSDAHAATYPDSAMRNLFGALAMEVRAYPTIELALPRLEQMARSDLRYYAASRGHEADKDRSAGKGRYTPDVATFASLLITSAIRLAQTLAADYMDVDTLEQVATWEHWAEAEHARRLQERRAALAHHRLYHSQYAVTPLETHKASRAYNRKQPPQHRYRTRR